MRERQVVILAGATRPVRGFNQQELQQAVDPLEDVTEAHGCTAEMFFAVEPTRGSYATERKILRCWPACSTTVATANITTSGSSGCR